MTAANEPTSNDPAEAQFLAPRTHQTAAGENTSGANSIRATEVPQGRRLHFLPRLFGPRYMLGFEGMLFDWAARLSASYSGGYWNFYELSNGGAYAVPRMGPLVPVRVYGNGFEGSVTQDAFGVIVSLFALNDLAFCTRDSKVIDLYHALRAFACEHAEAATIVRAID